MQQALPELYIVALAAAGLRAVVVRAVPAKQLHTTGAACCLQLRFDYAMVPVEPQRLSDVAALCHPAVQ